MGVRLMETQQQSEKTPVAIAFPSIEWFHELARLMRENRAIHEHLGFIDCVARFTVLDGGPAGKPWSAIVAFEEFEAVEVTEDRGGNDERADFTLEASLASWHEMIANIAQGRGRPDLTHTINYLSHMGTPFRLLSDDPLRRDLFFRYNQSLQEFFNASAGLRTIFGE